MNHLPIVLVTGEAGSGKDTVGSYIAQTYGGTCLGLADPMKRWASEIFEFTDQQLWAPSETRNAPDQSTVVNKLAISGRFAAQEVRLGQEIFAKVLPPNDAHYAWRRMNRWFETFVYHNLENDIPVSPRLVLQTLGTEWGRAVDEDMWVRYGIATGKRLLGGDHTYTREGGLVREGDRAYFNFVAITDGRFPNEVINVRSAGGIAIKVIRPDLDRAAVQAGGAKNHKSEKLDRIPLHFFDAVITNDGTLEQLKQKVEWTINLLFEGVEPVSERGQSLYYPRKVAR